jgi:tetratricopeptide (TPR) repeat protein
MINRCIETHVKKKQNFELKNEISENKILGGGARKYVLDESYVPDECDIGACLYFKGISLNNLNRIEEALVCFLEVLDNKWIVKKKSKIFKKFHIQKYYDSISLSREHNRMLCFFSIGKIYQRNGQHALALQYFSQSLEVIYFYIHVYVFVYMYVRVYIYVYV